MEPQLQPLATVRKWHAAENRGIKRKPLPSVAFSCREQRRPAGRAFPVQDELFFVERAVGMEAFMEPSGRQPF
jgi:hypothetical protein